MTIANRIILGFAAVTVLLLGVGLFGLVQIGVVKDTTETIVTRDMAVVRQIAQIRTTANEMRAASDAVITSYLSRSAGGAGGNEEDPVTRWRQRGVDMDSALEKAASAARDYRQTALSAERADAWRRIEDYLNQTAASSRQGRTDTENLFSAIRRNDSAGVAAAQTALVQRRGEFGRGIQGAEDVLDDAILSGQRRINDVYKVSQVSIIVALIVASIIAGVITWAIRGSIVGPLGAFMGFVGKVGEGDLTGRAAATSTDEIGKLGGTLNTMVDGLVVLARQSREATENLNAATAEIRASTQEQAASVEEQLAAVQETAATVDEITHSGAQIGKRAQEVIASAQATAHTSNEGLRAVDETAKAMDAIREQAEAVAENIVALSEKTQAIGDIIATVNDISERSHLLALNAAIEAASAGENGRSFAVVASEMKMLADQAKEATTQVRSILGDIQRGINASVMLTEEAVKRVAAGKERTDTTQRTITEITGRVQESVQTFQQIVASTNQQQLGIEQVMGALQNIRQASQQTAAGTRQLDEAAANLSDLSRQLLALSERYRT
ncbi:methyl-accepting chemotaxis protein [Caulobacter sp. CCNWLY153]|uniref:Methyl-accepting chemotaxis protein n=1 Tax=Caulobacter radicis TaxID=2172650 RepID=A0A2T9JTG4_9CAUL|nr:methyl-accepting chemotaxis protein [Caulobacter radicis]PVM86984.1 methyl-accepting chemotaxis protein [Caulobacter radicis]